MGLAGFGGGFCLQSDRIPDQDIFIGYKEGNTLSMLPFYEKSISSEKDSFAKDENGSELQEHAFTEEEVSRSFGLATDTFQAGRLSFSLMNRVTELSDVERGEEPEVKSKALPAIVARFCVDNRSGCGSPEINLYSFPFLLCRIRYFKSCRHFYLLLSFLLPFYHILPR